jgi:hypothetical protein
MAQRRQLTAQLQIQQQGLKGFQLGSLYPAALASYTARNNTKPPRITRKALNQQGCLSIRA